MSRLKLIYIGLLVLLGVVLVFAVFKPIATSGKYTEVQRQSLLKSDSGWVIQFSISNHEGVIQNYSLHFVIEGSQPYVENIQLRDKTSFTFIRRIPLNELEGKNGDVSFAVYKSGQATPIESLSYHLE
jgi:hypothetical protein